jgi:hypothetical protein
MPGMPTPPAGGLPSPLTQGSPNAGGATQPQGNQGNIAAAMVKVKNAIQLLQEALPLIPMGDELHTEILNSAKSLSKHLKKGDESPQLDIASLLNTIKQKAASAPQAAMARQFAGGAGAGQPPATPQPEAA